MARRRANILFDDREEVSEARDVELRSRCEAVRLVRVPVRSDREITRERKRLGEEPPWEVPEIAANLDALDQLRIEDAMAGVVDEMLDRMRGGPLGAIRGYLPMAAWRGGIRKVWHGKRTNDDDD